MKQLYISIVLYKNDVSIEKTIASIMATSLDIKLILIDNSPTDELKYLATDKRILYLFNGNNVGYGAGHNIALKRSLAERIKYHLVMNPDINFDKGTLEEIYAYMDQHEDTGSLMPKVYYENGSLQRLCKLLPTPLNLIGRRFMRNTSWAKKKMQNMSCMILIIMRL
ncbi:glycosyltransferase [Pedobacter steynii]